MSSEDADTYLYLREGVTRTGAVAPRERRPPGQLPAYRRYRRLCPAGETYTIEATTKNPKEPGSFALTVSGLDVTVAPQPSDCAQTIAVGGQVSGQWAPGCESETSAPGSGSGARLARYYTFNLEPGIRGGHRLVPGLRQC